MSKSLDQEVEELVLRWSMHVERMDKTRVVNKEYESDFEGQ